jgi:hypothetical protein
MIKLKVKGNLNKDVRAEIEKQRQKITEDLLNKLKEATPVDTGNARDGWKIDGRNIVNNVNYISVLNEGTSKQAPAHFIEKTVLNNPNVKPNGVIVQHNNTPQN